MAYISKVCRWNFQLCCRTTKLKGINKCKVFSQYHYLKQHIIPAAYQHSSTVNNVKDPEWIIIYHFPFIPYAAALNRFKIYQTSLTILSIPIGLSLYSNNMITLNDLQVIGTAATLASLTLILFSYYFRRLIGIIYFNKETQTVKISHLTFWGRRKNILVNIEDIVPLTDGDCRAKDAYLKLHRYSTKEFLLLSLRFGKILKKEEFELIFGSLSFLYDTSKMKD